MPEKITNSPSASVQFVNEQRKKVFELEDKIQVPDPQNPQSSKTITLKEYLSADYSDPSKKTPRQRYDDLMKNFDPNFDPEKNFHKKEDYLTIEGKQIRVSLTLKKYVEDQSPLHRFERKFVDVCIKNTCDQIKMNIRGDLLRRMETLLKETTFPILRKNHLYID